HRPRVSSIRQRLAILESRVSVVAAALIREASQMMRARAGWIDLDRSIQIRSRAGEVLPGQIQLAQIDQAEEMISVHRQRGLPLLDGSIFVAASLPQFAKNAARLRRVGHLDRVTHKLLGAFLVVAFYRANRRVDQ